MLTNPRALDARGLEFIRQLPVRTAVHEWTLAREQQVLAETFACFLPVNAQGFSTAKSQNRAVTALSKGCQIISAGYPLYERFGDLIYREPQSFLADLARGQMRLSESTVPDLDRMMKQFAGAAREAIELVRFIKALAPVKNDRDLPLVLIHGHVADGAIHKLVQSLHGLSVAGPFCTAKMNYDVIFRRKAGRIAMFLSQTAIDRLEPDLRRRLRARDKLVSWKLWELPESENTASDSGGDSSDAASLPFQLASYRSTMEDIRTRLVKAFGPCRLISSENSPLPFEERVETAGSC